MNFKLFSTIKSDNPKKIAITKKGGMVLIKEKEIQARYVLKKTESLAPKVSKSPKNSGYSRHGASVMKTSLQGWITDIASPYEDIERNIETLRERSRDLYMGAPIASGALKSLRTNIVGSGLKLNSRIDAELLNMSQEEADIWETTAEREFDLWADSKNCDLSRMSDFYSIQQVAFLSFLMSGDCFVLLPMHKRKGTPYELCIQLLEADRICNPGDNSMPATDKVINGVEIDDKGEVVAYHIAKKHPKSAIVGQNSWTRVQKFGSLTGRANVIHLVEFERPEQRRGVPILAPVIETMKQVSRYTSAELMAAVIDAMHTIYIESEAADRADIGGVPAEDEIDSEDDSTVEIGSGAVNFLREGEKVHESKPSRPNTAFDGFVVAMCRQIGVALEIPYEVLMKHFTSSYSASRGALLEAWKMFRMRRDWLARNFCQPIYEEFLAEAIAKNRIYAPGFFDDPLIRKAYSKSEWNGPSQGQLDPLKEVNAAEKRVLNGFSTRTKESIELTGTDYFQNHTLRVVEEAARREAGFDRDYAEVLLALAQYPEEDTDNDDEEEKEK